MLLQDKVVVVSGIGPDLGRSFALRAAGQGADVVLAARSADYLEVVAEEVRGLGRRALTVPTDITAAGDPEKLARATVDEFGRADVLVNNAFRMAPQSDLLTLDDDEVRKAMEVTVFGTLAITRAFADILAASEGAVLIVNSVVVKHSNQPFGPYKMTKHALDAVAKSLATELGPRGVRVNQIAPGWIWGEKLKRAFSAMAEQQGTTQEAIYTHTAASTDLRRLPVPDRIADAGLALSSDMCIDVTGQMLEVSCGEYHH